MTNEESRYGERIIKIAFLLRSDGDEDLKRVEVVVGLQESGEEIAALWSEVSSDFLTITMTVAPPDSRRNMAEAVQGIVDFVTKSAPPEPTKSKKKHSRPAHTAPAAQDEDKFLTAADALLQDMIETTDRIETRKRIIRIAEITGPIDLTNYIEKANAKGVSVKNFRSKSELYPKSGMNQALD